MRPVRGCVHPQFFFILISEIKESTVREGGVITFNFHLLEVDLKKKEKNLLWRNWDFFSRKQYTHVLFVENQQFPFNKSVHDTQSRFIT